MPRLDRRRFVQGLGAAMAAAAVPRPLLVKLGRSWEPAPPIQDSRLKELTARALDAARAAGAAYADVRLTHVRTRDFSTDRCTDGEDLQAGVRALVAGYWGFAGGPIWSPDEMARLGAEAVHQARANSLGASRVVDLAPAPPIADGHWEMPVARDPFEVSPFEITDFLDGLNGFAASRGPHIKVRDKAGSAPYRAIFKMQEKAFASSAGSYCTQRLYTTMGELDVIVEKADQSEQLKRRMAPISPAGLGWELFTADRIPGVREHSLRDEIDRMIEAIDADLRLPRQPVDVGRFDAVCDARTMQSLVASTLGFASELDRDLGYEANAEGTTFVTDPLQMLGSLQVAAESVTLAADRSTPGGAATVSWDDEGVVPDDMTLVKAGVLNDFQTVRESAGWLKERYAAMNRPWRSHGCANAASAIAPPMQFPANLSLQPGARAVSYEDLVTGIGRGLALEDAVADMDFQASSGEMEGGGYGRIYKIEHGRKVARLVSAAALFRATELWKSLRTLGGAAGLRRYGMKEDKGEPEQSCFFSVTSPPAVFRQLAIVDKERKA